MKQEGWLLKQGFFLTIIAIFIAIISFGKEAIFANFFGVSIASDAYTIAIQVPEILFAVVWESVGTVVIPLYTDRLHNGGQKAACRFFSTMLTIVCFLSITFICFGELLTDLIVLVFSPGLSNETHDLAVALMKWTFPVLIFEGIIRVITGVLNVHNQFVVPRVLTCVRNVGVIVFLFLFSKEFGVYAATIGLLTGIIIECLLCVLSSIKHEKYIFVNTNDFRDSAIRKAGVMVLPLIIGIGSREINHMADKIMASFFSAGSISSLNYASKLSSIIEVTLLSNVVCLLYPRYSEFAAKGQNKELGTIFERTINVCCLMCVPIIFGAFFLRKEIVSLAFERGAFDGESVLIVSNLFAVYIICSMFTTINGACVKVLASCGDTKTSTIISVIGVAANIILNIILSHFWGVIGLVVATSISSVVMCIGLFWAVRRKVYKYSFFSISTEFLKCVIAGGAMFAALNLLKPVYIGIRGNSTLIGLLMYCLISVVVAVLIYGFFIAILRVKVVQLFLERIVKRVKSN